MTSRILKADDFVRPGARPEDASDEGDGVERDDDLRRILAILVSGMPSTFSVSKSTGGPGCSCK